MKWPQPVGSLILVLLVVTLGFGTTLQRRSHASRVYVVMIENMKFTPAVVTISPGDTVEFKNADLVPHNVTERKAKLFDSGMISPNMNWKYLAEQPGKFGYHCIYHPDMTGSIIVGNVTDPTTSRDVGNLEVGGEF
ncbi:MAG TPA: cupredoxin domain-containing protein [Lacunisphaera sp.]|jgi:plastocyanin